MREIKFRAWDGERMALSADVRDMMFAYGFNYDYIDANKLEEIPIMQFTGLKDKIGVDIYEGDIVRATFGRGNPLIEVVEYDSGLGFTPIQAPCDYDDVYYSESDIEVVGNIHQHPELLEGE